MTIEQLRDRLTALSQEVTNLGHQRIEGLKGHRIFIIHSEIEPIAYLEKAFDKVIKDLK